MTQARVQVGPHTIAVRFAGPHSSPHPTFILVHGIGVSGRYFGPLIAELAGHVRVVSLDLPGFGDSSRPSRALSIAQHARIVAQLIIQEQWPHPVLVGQSMGCQIVGHILRQHPQLASRAVLISPTTNDRERTAGQQALRLMQDTMREPLSVNAIVFGDYLRCGILRYHATLQSILTDCPEDYLPHCTARVLIIRGQRDRIVPDYWADKFARLLPHGSLITVPHAPHLVQYTAAKTVAHLCRTFAQQA